MFKLSFFILVLILYASVSAKSEGHFKELYNAINSMKQCFYEKYIGVCLKERALEALNETALSNEPITVGIMMIEKNKDYNWNHTVDLPTDLQQRSTKLTDILWEKIYEFFRSRTVRFNIWDAMVEGRGKKGGGGLGGKGNMMMMAACAGAGMMVGKMGMMAAGAMMMSKMALLMSLIMLLKKSKGGGGDEGGGEEKKIKIVYASEGGGGGDYGKGGGGGWHRSLSSEPQSLAYRGHSSPSENTNVVYEDNVSEGNSNRRCQTLVDRRVGSETIPSN